MSLDLDAALDALTPDYNAKSGPSCSVQKLLDTLPPETAARLLTKIDDLTIQASAITGTLREAGYRINDSSLRRHRRRSKNSGCTCPR
jgi:transposase InsO family protein